MAYDDEFNQELEFQREDYYSRKMECCANCGSKEVSCTAGNEAFCGDCFRERSAEKAARRASVAQPPIEPRREAICAYLKNIRGSTVLICTLPETHEGDHDFHWVDTLQRLNAPVPEKPAAEPAAPPKCASYCASEDEPSRPCDCGINQPEAKSLRDTKASDCAGIHLCQFCLNTFIELGDVPAELATLRQKPAQPPKMKGEWRLVEEYKPEGRDISFRMSYFLEGCTTPVWTFWAKWDGCFTLISHANGSTIDTTDECDDDMHFCGGGWDGIRALMEIQALGEKRFGKEYWGKK